MAYDNVAEEFLNRWRRNGHAPINDSIVLTFTDSNPPPGGRITVNWRGSGPCVNILLNDQPYLENQTLEGQFTLDVPNSLNGIIVTAVCGSARAIKEVKPSVMRPEVHQFTIDKKQVYLDDEFCLDWAVADAAEISISLINDETQKVFNQLADQGQLPLKAPNLGDYRIVLLAKSTHAGLSHEAQITKEIKFSVIRRPITIELDVSAQEILPGGIVVLTWRVREAVSVKLDSPLLTHAFDQTSGELKFRLFTNAEFTLSATDFDRQIVSKAIAIKVKLLPDEPSIETELAWFADLLGG